MCDTLRLVKVADYNKIMLRALVFCYSMVDEVLPPTQHSYRLYRSGLKDVDRMMVVIRYNHIESL